MSFHLGKPILLMLIVGCISAAWVAVQPPARQLDLVLWVFADAHAQTYRSIINQFEKQNNVKVDIQNLSLRAETVRLESMFMSGQSGNILPDVIEMEISYIGRF